MSLYLGWSRTVLTYLTWKCLKTSTPLCGWWISFRITTPFQQTQRRERREPLSAVMIFSWHMILRTIFLSPTTTEDYHWGLLCHVHKCESSASFFYLISKKYIPFPQLHSKNRLLVGCFANHCNLDHFKPKVDCYLFCITSWTSLIIILTLIHNHRVTFYIDWPLSLVLGEYYCKRIPVLKEVKFLELE